MNIDKIVQFILTKIKTHIKWVFIFIDVNMLLNKEWNIFSI